MAGTTYELVEMNSPILIGENSMTKKIFKIDTKSILLSLTVTVTEMKLRTGPLVTELAGVVGLVVQNMLTRCT